MKALLASLIILSAVPASAEVRWRVRAREHFETGKLNLADGQGDLAYRGFLSAFNLFREEPMDLSYGLTVHRGKMKRVGWNERVTVTRFGAEVKHFPWKEHAWFWRGNISSTAADPTDSGGELWLHGLGAGAGFEIPVWKLGVAPEVGGLCHWGPHGKKLNDFYVALGVHFYVFKGDGSEMEKHKQ